MNKTILRVEGMTCNNCKIKLEHGLSSLKNVIDVQVFVSKNKLIVTHDDQLVLDDIKDEISRLGYHVSLTKNNLIVRNIITYVSLLVLAYFIIKYENRVSFDFIPNIRQSMGYGTLFIVGLFTSLHCVAMCGGIGLSQCSKQVSGNKLQPSFLYNLGRLISYTMIGAIVGGIGNVISITGQSKGYFTLLISVLMIAMSLKMLKLLHFNIPQFYKNNKNISIKKTTSNKNPLIVGLLNGFMPCGPLQTMQLYALGTGSILMGALSMFYFGLGTFPLMFALGFISTFLNSRFSKKILSFSGLLVFILAVSMFSRALSLSGLAIINTNSGDIIQASIEDNVQIVEFDLSSDKYEPIQVKKDIPVKLIINASPESINGCNNPLTVPKLDVTAKLKPGINIIEFTPTSEGKIVYTCWMGMITSYIDVIE